MNDAELLGALTVLARRLGLVPDGKRLALVDEDPTPKRARMRDAVSLCLAATVYADRYPIDCRLPYGHEGDHRQDEIHWPQRSANSGELGTVCEAPSPLQPGPDCVYRAGHVGSHSNDPTEPRAS